VGRSTGQERLAQVGVSGRILDLPIGERKNFKKGENLEVPGELAFRTLGNRDPLGQETDSETKRECEESGSIMDRTHFVRRREEGGAKPRDTLGGAR